MIPTTDQVDLAVEVFRVLADSTRVRLLWPLLDHEQSVKELAEAVGKASAGVSQHLAKLRMARLVQARRQASQVFYRISSSHVAQPVEDAIYHAETVPAAFPSTTAPHLRSASSAEPNPDESINPVRHHETR